MTTKTLAYSMDLIELQKSVMNKDAIQDGIIIDTNAFIYAAKTNGIHRSLINYVKKNFQTVITPEIKYEIQKHANHILPEIINSSIILSSNDNVQDISEQIDTAHFPDNRIIAHAKASKCSLITDDLIMLKAAKKHGVQAYNPKQFMMQIASILN